MNTKTNAARTVQGGAQDIPSVGGGRPSHRIDIFSTSWQGHGDGDGNETAQALDALARRLARQVATRAESFGSPRANGDMLAELESIQRAQMARAWRVSRSVPVVGRLFAETDYMRGSGRLAWVRAIKRAERECVAEIDKLRRARRRLVSLESAGDGEDESQGRELERALSARCQLVKGRISRRTVRHARECLVAFWTLTDSRKWRAALADDLRTLARLVVASRYGSAVLGDTGTGTGESFRDTAARKSIQRLISRMGQGDVLLTDQSDRAEKLLSDWRAERARLA